ncbi:MAG: nucleoside triphosphate pyrophosphatase [Bradymonadaceae bacterium]
MSSSLILASGSEYKRSLLQRLGLDFRTLPAEIDEHASGDDSLPPAEEARLLARRKVRDVQPRADRAFVLASDQIVSLGDRRFSKPGSAAAAARQLRALSGRSHRLVAAVALAAPDGELYIDSVCHEMEMRDLDDDEILTYVDEDQPLDCAGSYKVESRGIRLFRAMRGDDYTAIVGLPLTRVWNTLERAGYFETTDSDA